MTRVGDDTGRTRSSHEDELLEATRQIETLRQALVSRGVIDQAKGVLIPCAPGCSTTKGPVRATDRGVSAV